MNKDESNLPEKLTRDDIEQVAKRVVEILAEHGQGEGEMAMLHLAQSVFTGPIPHEPSCSHGSKK